jgi:DNA repair protein RecO (recombination protein O)
VSVITTPAILLRSHAYSETSWILRFLSEDHGVVAVMAKGARKRQSLGNGSLETFAEGELTIYWKENRELQTFKDFSGTRDHRALSSRIISFGGASVLAELVLRHAGSEGNPELYHRMAGALASIEASAESAQLPMILAGIWGIVESLGYRPMLDSCVHCGTSLGAEEIGRFDFSAGGIRCAACGVEGTGPRLGPGARAEVEALLSDSIPDSVTHPRGHLSLVRDFITYHVSGTHELQSFSFLIDQVSADDA